MFVVHLPTPSSNEVSVSVNQLVVYAASSPFPREADKGQSLQVAEAHAGSLVKPVVSPAASGGGGPR
jgi:hypothetical protein